MQVLHASAAHGGHLCRKMIAVHCGESVLAGFESGRVALFEIRDRDQQNSHTASPPPPLLVHHRLHNRPVIAVLWQPEAGVLSMDKDGLLISADTTFHQQWQLETGTGAVCFTLGSQYEQVVVGNSAGQACFIHYLTQTELGRKVGPGVARSPVIMCDIAPYLTQVWCGVVLQKVTQIFGRFVLVCIDAVFFFCADGQINSGKP